MHRRTLLKGAGVALALPNLEMFERKPEKVQFVGVCGPLGVYPPTFFLNVAVKIINLLKQLKILSLSEMT